MRKIILFVICMVIPLSLAGDKKELKTFNTGKLDVIEMLDVDSDKENNDGQRKRDSGYSYQRPDRQTKFQSLRLSRGPERYVTRLPVNIIKPFKWYGPPKQTSLHVFLSNHQRLRAQSQRQRNRYHHTLHSSGNANQFAGSKKPNVNTQLELSNSFKEPGVSSQSNAIASQNEVPFNHNTANYLPPKNQKLPAYSSKSLQPFNHNINLQTSQKQIHNSQSHTHQLSDAAQFLTQNANAISQLYDAPASNVNYAPTPENFDHPTNNQLPNSNSQLQTLDIVSAQQSQFKHNADAFTGQLPSYSSGIIESRRVLDMIIAEQKSRLIAQLQEALTSQRETSVSDATGYTQNPSNYYDNQKLLDESVKFHNQNHQEAFGGTNVIFGQTSLQHGNPVTSYGTPVHPVTNQTPSTLPQSTAGTGSSHIPTMAPTLTRQPTAALPFPQYGGFVSTINADANFVSGLPSHYGSTFIGSNPFSSPTHFSIGTANNNNNNNNNNIINKPITGSAPSIPVASKPIFPSFPSSLPVDQSISLPTHVGHAISVNPIQPILPINPASTPLQKPTLASHSTVVNSVILRPLKPTYPVYYYHPNNAYQLQNPAVALPTYPWRYMPFSLQTKPNQT